MATWPRLVLSGALVLLSGAILGGGRKTEVEGTHCGLPPQLAQTAGRRRRPRRWRRRRSGNRRHGPWGCARCSRSERWWRGRAPRLRCRTAAPASPECRLAASRSASSAFSSSGVTESSESAMAAQVKPCSCSSAMPSLAPGAAAGTVRHVLHRQCASKAPGRRHP